MTELSREEVLKIAFSGWCLENQILLELDESEALILFQTAYEAGAKSERAVSDRLLEALKDARIDIEEWGAYAGDYFQEKWGLQEDLSRYDRLIAAVEAMRKEKPE